MKIEKKDIFGFIFCLLIVCGLFYLCLYFSDKGIKNKECLKQFAEKYCNSKNMILKGNTGVIFFCSEDLRSQSVKYDYLKEEIEYCKKNYANVSEGGK